jgi:hypothetical protein
MARSEFDKPPAGPVQDDWFVRQLIEGLSGQDTPPISLSQTLDVDGAATLASLMVEGGSVLVGDLAVGSPAVFTVGSGSGNTAIAGTLDVTGAITGASTVEGTQLISTVATGTSPLVVDSTTLVANLNAALLGGFSKAQLDALYVDVAGDTMTGALVIAISAGGGNDQALFLKHNAGAGQFTLGASNAADPVLIFKDHSGDQTFEVGNLASTYQARVIGDFNVSDDAVIAGDISASRAVVGGTTWSGGEELRVVGQTRLEGAATITTGGLTVSADGIVVAGGGLAVTGAITATTSIAATTGISAGASSAFTGGVSVVTGGLTILAGGLGVTGNFGTFGATPAAKQSVTGSRGGNAAVLSIIAALETYGLISNNTTP